MMPMNSVFEPAITLNDIVEVFDKLCFPYFLVGSFASGFRGEFRATNDLDIVCDFSVDQCEQFIIMAKEKFYCDEVAVSKAVQENSSFNLIHESSFVKVDIFLKVTEFERQQFPLCSNLIIPSTNRVVKVSTAEYNIIAKINWYVKSNRVLERQLLDVRSMIAVNRNSLDYSYLSNWAKHFNISNLLNQLLEAE